MGCNSGQAGRESHYRLMNLISSIQGCDPCVSEIGSALAERVGQGEVGGATALADHAWRLLQLAIEKARSALDGPLFCFLVQMGVENSPFTL